MLRAQGIPSSHWSRLLDPKQFVHREDAMDGDHGFHRRLDGRRRIQLLKDEYFGRASSEAFDPGFDGHILASLCLDDDV